MQKFIDFNVRFHFRFPASRFAVIVMDKFKTVVRHFSNYRFNIVLLLL